MTVSGSNRMMSVVGWWVQRCPGCGHLIVALEPWQGPAIGVRISLEEALLLGRVRHPAYRASLRRALGQWPDDNTRVQLHGDGGRIRAKVLRDVESGAPYEIPFVSAILVTDLADVQLLVEASLAGRHEDLAPAEEDVHTFREFIDQVSAEDFRDFDSDRTSSEK